MNTIPSTFNEKQIQHTIIGCTNESIKTPKGKIPLSVILLSLSGSTFRTSNLESLYALGFTDIISVELPSQNYNLYDFSKKFPSVKFIVPHQTITTGDMINLAMQEASNSKVLIMWDTMHISTKVLSERLVERLLDESVACFVPFLFTNQMQNLPAKNVPFIDKGIFSVNAFTVCPDNCKTLYPFDFVGVYDKAKFLKLGGFDYTITSSYWQLLDFALRTWLWGEKILVCANLRLNYEGEVPAEVTTSDVSYLRFFLKNLCHKFDKDHAYIPKKEFFPYMSRANLGFTTALKTFRQARSWVLKNQYNIKMDAKSFIENWENQ